MATTRSPRAPARTWPTLAHVVVLPTPPFMLTKATVHGLASGRLVEASCSAVRRSRGLTMRRRRPVSRQSARRSVPGGGRAAAVRATSGANEFVLLIASGRRMRSIGTTSGVPSSLTDGHRTFGAGRGGTFPPRPSTEVVGGECLLYRPGGTRVHDRDHCGEADVLGTDGRCSNNASSGCHGTITGAPIMQNARVNFMLPSALTADAWPRVLNYLSMTVKTRRQRTSRLHGVPSHVPTMPSRGIWHSRRGTA